MPATNNQPETEAVLTLNAASSGIPSLTVNGIEIAVVPHPEEVDIMVRVRVRDRVKTYRERLSCDKLPLSAVDTARLFPVAVDAALGTHRNALHTLLDRRIEVVRETGRLVFKVAGDAQAVLAGATMVGGLRIDPAIVIGDPIPSADERSWRRLPGEFFMGHPEMAHYPCIIHLRNRAQTLTNSGFALMSPFDEFLGMLALWPDLSRPDGKGQHGCAVFMPARMSFQPTRDTFQEILAKFGQLLIGMQQSGRMLMEYHLEVEPDESHQS